MKIFFYADKYITRVESPRVSRTLSRKDQIPCYIDKYFDSFSTEYLGEVHEACTEYIEDTADRQGDDTKSVTVAELQAVTTIIKGLQDFINKGRHNEFKYMRMLAANEAFKLYCGMISKTLEMNVIDRKQAKRRITKFYDDCGLD